MLNRHVIAALLAISLAAVIGVVHAQGVPEGPKPVPKPAAKPDAESQDEGSAPKSESAEALLRVVTTPEMLQSISEGLDGLAALQDKEGWFGEQGTRIATTSLAGLALLASGSLPGSGPYGTHIQKTIDWLLANQDQNNGYFTGNGDGSRIHGHGYALLFLSQALGSLPDGAGDGQVPANDRLRKAVTRASRLLEAGQTKDGGWGYVPDDNTWDEGSTTVCVLQGLRAAQSAGISVKNSVIANAIGYLEKIATPQTFKAPDGTLKQAYTFKYSLSSGISTNSWALVAASVACLNNVGVYSKTARWDAREMGKILDGGMRWLRYLQDEYLDRYRRGQGALDTSHFYYANFYACQACWQYEDVEYFKDYFPKVRDVLVREQRTGPGKVWPNSNYGAAHSTAFALLILQVPYQYLPAFQR